MLILDTLPIITNLYVMVFGIFFGFIGFIILLGLVAKTIRFFTYRFSSIKVQKGELIKKKMFKCSDLYELKWKGEINSEGTHIIVYIHDFLGNRNDSEEMEKWFFKKDSNVSVVSYDQRSFGDNELENDPNYGANISDLKEIIDELKDKHKNQKVILIGHGYGANLAIRCADEIGVEKVIAASLKIVKGYKNSFSNKSMLFWSWLFSSKNKINYQIDPVDLTDSSEFAKKLQRELEVKNICNARQYYQMNHLLKVAMKRCLKKAKNKIIIFQPAKSIYTNTKKFVKLTNGIDVNNVEVFKDSKHHLFNSKDNEAIFNNLYKIVKNI